MKAWFVSGIAAAALLSAGFAIAGSSLSPTELEPLIKSGKILPLEILEKAARDKHPGGKVNKGEVERHNGGYIYEVEVTDSDGKEWDMDLDASTGLMLKDDDD